MKKINLISWFILVALFVKGQQWEPIGAGIDYDPNDVYPEAIFDPVMALCEYHGKLYIGGSFINSGKRKISNLACWDGKKIDTVGRGVDGPVCALLSYGRELCIGGLFTKRAPNHTAGEGIILWRDTIGLWTAMDNAFGSMRGPITYGLFIFKNSLYAGGYFSYQSANCIAKWNGSSWDKLGADVNWNFPGGGLLGCVGAMEEFNGKLYAGGEFHIYNPDYNHYIAFWDGKKWNEVGKSKQPDDLPGLCTSPSSGIVAMKVYRGYLYVGGSFDTITGKHFNRFARWNDTTWSDIGNFNGKVTTMVIYNDKLYIGGAFDSIDSKPFMNIACWDGKSLSAVGEGLEATNHNLFKGRVDVLAVYKDELYAGGYFNFSGKTILNNIAKFNLNKKSVIQKQ